MVIAMSDDLDVMIDSLIPHRASGRRFIAGFILGLIGGGAVAALTLPRSGPALRALLAERAPMWLRQLRDALRSERPL